jgi:hypothetical protein
MPNLFNGDLMPGAAASDIKAPLNDGIVRAGVDRDRVRASRLLSGAKLRPVRLRVESQHLRKSAKVGRI